MQPFLYTVICILRGFLKALKKCQKERKLVEVTPKWAKPTLLVGSLIDDVPVVENYKYLGVLFDSKLSGNAQMSSMNKKVHFLSFRLAPLLNRVSLDYRINLWKTLVRPLFKASIAIIPQDNLTQLRKLERNFKVSFKKFVGLSVSTDDDILRKLLNFNIKELAARQEFKASLKWRERLLRLPYITCLKDVKVKTPLLPRAFTKYCNIQKSKCTVCKGPFINSVKHLQIVHNLPVPSSLELLDELENDFPRSIKILSRLQILKLKEKCINFYLSSILNLLQGKIY